HGVAREPQMAMPARLVVKARPRGCTNSRHMLVDGLYLLGKKGDILLHASLDLETGGSKRTLVL
ncbi:MAG: hypothetical protein ACXVZT_07085, partial [Terriglobales bacterium]